MVLFIEPGSRIIRESVSFTKTSVTLSNESVLIGVVQKITLCDASHTCLCLFHIFVKISFS